MGGVTAGSVTAGGVAVGGVAVGGGTIVGYTTGWDAADGANAETFGSIGRFVVEVTEEESISGPCCTNPVGNLNG